MACLPDRLKAELAIHVHLDTLKRVDIFQNTEAGFLCELVLRLKPVLFSPGDYVCRKNEVGHDMYIVSRGILEVVTNEGKTVVATLKAGSYFGEISVLNVGSAGNKRTASVRSVGYSDLFCLNKQDLWDVLKDYPNAETRIRARAEERLSKLGASSSGAQALARRSNAASKPLASSGSRRKLGPGELAPQAAKLQQQSPPTFEQSTKKQRPPTEGHRRRVFSSASSCQRVAAALEEASAGTLAQLRPTWHQQPVLAHHCCQFEHSCSFPKQATAGLLATCCGCAHSHNAARPRLQPKQAQQVFSNSEKQQQQQQQQQQQLVQLICNHFSADEEADGEDEVSEPAACWAHPRPSCADQQRANSVRSSRLARELAHTNSLRLGQPSCSSGAELRKSTSGRLGHLSAAESEQAAPEQADTCLPLAPDQQKAELIDQKQQNYSAPES